MVNFLLLFACQVNDYTMKPQWHANGKHYLAIIALYIFYNVLL